MLTRMMKAIGVFCGSKSGASPAYLQAAQATGHALVQAGLTLVYGGGKVGLMGAVADATLAAGGEVIGVMPRSLVEKEIAHRGLSTLHVVETMHERKLKMAELSDGFLALPGGAGTLEELFEQWTWAQLGIHAKPCGLLNVEGYFDPLLQLTSRMTAEGFMAAEHAAMLVCETEPTVALTHFAAYRPPTPKWTASSTAEVRP